MKQSNFTSPIILLVFILIIIVIAWGFLFYEIYQNRIEARIVLNEIEVQKAKDISFTSVHSLVQDIKDSVSTLNSSFINSEDIVGFIKDLESEANSVQAVISISNLNFDSESKDIVKPLTARVDIEGDWRNVLMLIGRIERMPKSISIDRVALSRFGDLQAKTSSWKASFDIKVFAINRGEQ